MTIVNLPDLIDQIHDIERQLNRMSIREIAWSDLGERLVARQCEIVDIIAEQEQLSLEMQP